MRQPTPAWKATLDWDPAKVDELDYLMAGCAKRGIYITTDLYVSRPVSGRAIGLPQYDEAPDDKLSMDRYKSLVLVNEAAARGNDPLAHKVLGRHWPPPLAKEIY